MHGGIFFASSLFFLNFFYLKSQFFLYRNIFLGNYVFASEGERQKAKPAKAPSKQPKAKGKKNGMKAMHGMVGMQKKRPRKLERGSSKAKG